MVSKLIEMHLFFYTFISYQLNERCLFLIHFYVHSIQCLSQLVPPRWRIEPIDTSVVRGRNAIIDCDADAYPPPVTSWSRAEGKLNLRT
jgi:hypothetical protein